MSAAVRQTVVVAGLDVVAALVSILLVVIVFELAIIAVRMGKR